MICEEKEASVSRQTLGFPAGLLLGSPRRRLPRLGRKHSSGSVQSSSSDTTVKSGEGAVVRQPARNKIKRHNRGLVTVFRGRSVKDEQSGDEGGGERVSDDPAELSTQVTAPGVLKIFGGEICDGANYKSVLATPRSSAHELVKEALERYSLDKGRAGEFVLCDVIGKLDGEHQWRPECLRAVGDGEKPLTLQALWKPKEGFARRFELRCRAAMEEMAARERDTVTAGINAQARKLQVTRSRASSALTGEEMEWGAAIWRTLSETTLGTVTREPDSHGVGGQEDREPLCLGLEKEETESSDDIATQYSVRPPIEFPYFLLLQGYCDRQDYVIYTMNGTVHIFGRETEHSGKRDERVKVDMVLSAPDILPRHCRVRRCEASEGQEPGSGVTLVWPGKGALVTHNGRPLSRETELQSGDLLGLGACYLLLYKDPTRPGSGPKLSWFPGLAAGPDAGIGRCRLCGLELPDPSVERTRLWGREAVPGLHAPDGHQLRLCYRLPQEPELLSKILGLAGGSCHSTLAPAFLLCLCIQHSASTFPLADFRKLLLSIASHIQTMMWDKTQELAARQAESEQQDSQDCVEPSIADLIPGLQPLVYWMSNSVELLHFIQQEVPKLLGWERQLEALGSHSPQLVSTRAASEEAMTVLEEVIMFTFQQCVYYLTKTLYTVLPGLLDSNPFAASPTQLPVPLGVQNVLEILQETLKLLNQYQVHSDIASQLLAYLFFFSNASLFNTLMERGSGGGFYQWTKGVQIRANLDLLLDWIQGLGLGDLAAEFFQKLSTAVNLLATPRENLLQASWRSLRSDFASLNPAQLHHMIREYNPGRPCPAMWLPGPEEQEAAMRTADILESFDNHPPLILPTSTFHFTLDQPVTDTLSVQPPLREIQEFLQDSSLWATPEQTSSNQLLQETVPVSITSGQTRCLGSRVRLGAKGGGARGQGVLTDCEAELTHKLKNLEIESRLRGQQDLPPRRLPLDPSCLLTPPNTPQGPEPPEPETGGGACRRLLNGENDEEPNSGGPKGGWAALGLEDEEVFTVELERAPRGLGLALVDGLRTSLNVSGIYIRSLVPASPAAACSRLTPGDRILAVNGTNLVGMDYHSGRELIRTSGNKLRLLVAKSEVQVVMKVLATGC